MKILVISDTHRDLKNTGLAIKHTMETSLDMVIHCGDHIEDAKRLERIFPEITFHYVPGNCDGWFFKESEKTKILEVEDKKILFTHGDRHHIKYNYDQLFKAAEKEAAILALCGHSHMAHMERQNKTGIIAINPGSITLPRDSIYPSYTVLEVVKNQEIQIEMMIMKDGKSLKNPLFK